MADAWLVISSAEYDSHCGDTGGDLLVNALDGTDRWYHLHHGHGLLGRGHWFIKNERTK